MPTHAEKRILPYQVEQIFNLVAKVDKYPEFLPWAISSTIVSRKNNSFIADLEIGYKFIKTSYRSEVILTPHNSINIDYISGPFIYLTNKWKFTQINEKLMELDFYIDFEFKSSTYQALLQPAFHEVIRRMIHAFEKQAAKIYSEKTTV